MSVRIQNLQGRFMGSISEYYIVEYIRGVAEQQISERK